MMKTFSLTDLSEQEINIILGALGDMPFRTSAPLIQKLQSQLQPQITAAPAAKLAEEEVVSH